MSFFSFCPRRAGLIARVTLLEAMRQRLPQILLLGAAGLAVGVQGLRGINFGLPELKFIADLGFGGMVFFGSILTIFSGSHLFYSEIYGRSAVTVLAKPVSRTEFLAGKFIGMLGVAALFSVVMTMVIAFVLYTRESTLMQERPELFEHGGRLRYGDIFAAGFAYGLRFGVLAAFTLMIASQVRSSLHAVMASFGVLLICDLQYLAQEAYAHTGTTPLRLLAGLIALLFPDFQVFNLADLAGAEDGIQAEQLWRVTGYALCYIAAAGALAVFSFKRREI